MMGENLCRNGAKEKINRALPFGLDFGLLCTEDKDPVRIVFLNIYVV
jgi:hypothetical protein